MWQEIAVGLLVAASAFFIAKRFWNIFRADRTGSANCGCGCSACEQGFHSPSDCATAGLKEPRIR
jgi:FeoB-associated Cys-rich membrane protein